MQWNPRAMGTTLICLLFSSSALAAADSATRKPILLNKYERKPVNAPRDYPAETTTRKKIIGNDAASRQATAAVNAVTAPVAQPVPPPQPAAYYAPPPQPAYYPDQNAVPMQRPLPPEAYYQKYTRSENEGQYSDEWESLRERKSQYEYTLGVGYRVDDFNWSIAGDIDGTSPNILSELTWKDVAYSTIEGSIAYHQRPENSNLGNYLEASAFYGEAFDGKNQDSDYLGNNRTSEFSRSNNSADSGYVEGIKFGLGMTYHYDTPSSLWRLTGVGGYSYREQQLRMTDGFQTIPAFGSFGGLNSTYTTMWRGPYVGAELASYLNSAKHYFRFRAEYYLAEYDGVGNWNLRTDFEHPKSYRHRSDGDGVLFLLEYKYAFSQRLTVGFKGQWETWNADPGIDQVYFSNGTTGFTRLNEVEWMSQSYFLTLGYRF